MKIICVTASLPHGADEAFVIPEINQLRRCGHEVLVVPRSPRGCIMHGADLVSFARREALCSTPVLKAAGAAMLAAPGRTAAILGLLFGSRSPAVAIKNLA